MTKTQLKHLTMKERARYKALIRKQDDLKEKREEIEADLRQVEEYIRVEQSNIESSSSDDFGDLACEAEGLMQDAERGEALTEKLEDVEEKENVVSQKLERLADLARNRRQKG